MISSSEPRPEPHPRHEPVVLCFPDHGQHDAALPEVDAGHKAHNVPVCVELCRAHLRGELPSPHHAVLIIFGAAVITDQFFLKLHGCNVMYCSQSNSQHDYNIDCYSERLVAPALISLM